MSTTAQAKQSAGPGAMDSAKPDGAGAESGSTFRLDALGQSALEGLADKPKKRIPLHLILFAGLVVAAAGSLYGMRLVGLGARTVSADPKIEFEPPGSVVGKEHERILNDLTASHIEQQVPVEQVRRNPFEMPNSLENIPTGPLPQDDSVLAAKREREERERRQKEAEEHAAAVENALASITIHGILGGSVPIARINDKTVRVGDTVDMFTVTAIQGRSVELEVDGQKHIVSMDSPDDGSKPSPAPRTQPPASKPVSAKPTKPAVEPVKKK